LSLVLVDFAVVNLVRVVLYRQSAIGILDFGSVECRVVFEVQEFVWIKAFKVLVLTVFDQLVGVFNPLRKKGEE
jgi:hypothetical protein